MATAPVITAPPLDGVEKGTFVYRTIKDRWPKILTRVIDQVNRFYVAHTWIYGQDGDIDIKAVIQELAHMRYEMQTDKPLRCIDDNQDNCQLWNDRLIQLQNEMGENNVTWYKTPWLFTECYMYRRITASLLKTATLKEFDPFKFEKQNAIMDSLYAIEEIVGQLPFIMQQPDEKNTNLHRLMQLSLWGNRCDLSFSACDREKVGKLLNQLDHLRQRILINDIDKAIEVIGNAVQRIDIILDNFGFEVFADLLLADFLLQERKVNKVIFHGKAMPWFVSDVTKNDLHWLLEMLSEKHCEIRQVAARWKGYMEDGVFQFCDHEFWTLPFDYSEMSRYAEDLYKSLAESSLLIFKGDLNYRKLVGDRKWPLDFSFQKALRGFLPAPLIALRTLKAETQVGLSSETISNLEKNFKDNKSWMVSGKFAVAQFCSK